MNMQFLKPVISAVLPVLRVVSFGISTVVWPAFGCWMYVFHAPRLFDMGPFEILTAAAGASFLSMSLFFVSNFSANTIEVQK